MKFVDLFTFFESCNKMGRPKRSRDEKTKVCSPAKTKTVEVKPETTEVFAVSVLESPLLLCRSCRDSFETSEVSVSQLLF